MRWLKGPVKHLLWRMMADKNGYRQVRILSGKAKGTRLVIDFRDESAYWLGSYDRGVIDRIGAIVQPGWTAWDCGTYIGYYASAMRASVGASGKVVGFEASGPNFARVSKLPELNGWDNVAFHHLAVGKDHSDIRFASARGANSGPVDVPGKEIGVVGVGEQEIEVVQCCGLDELVYERGIPAPNFLKLDLEMAEVYALRNGDRLFREHRPVVLVEMHRQPSETRPAAYEAAEEFLAKYNYRGEEVHLGTPLKTVADLLETEKHGVQCTILAFPQ